MSWWVSLQYQLYVLVGQPAVPGHCCMSWWVSLQYQDTAVCLGGSACSTSCMSWWVSLQYQDTAVCLGGSACSTSCMSWWVSLQYQDTAAYFVLVLCGWNSAWSVRPPITWRLRSWLHLSDSFDFTRLHNNTQQVLARTQVMRDALGCDFSS